MGLRYTDLRQLHQMMVREVNSLRGSAAAGQKQSLLEVQLSEERGGEEGRGMELGEIKGGESYVGERREGGKVGR